MVAANSKMTKNAAINTQPHFVLSPNFFRVNLISESVETDDITDSAFPLRLL